MAYCFGVAGIAKAPWRPTLDDAHADAIDAGYATVEDHQGEDGHWGSAVYMIVPGEIWTTTELVPVLPRGPVMGMSPVPKRELTRIERIIARREAQERQAG